MDSFYLIVLSIAGILLILIWTAVALMMRKTKENTIFPQTSSTCPDYWLYDDGVCKLDSRNTGTLGTMTAANTPGFIASKNGFDSNNASWGSKYGKTVQCGKKKWAEQNKISWDGVSNFNGC